MKNTFGVFGLICMMILSGRAYGVVVRPATDGTEIPVNDPFAAYQWSLFPRDQGIISEIYFNHSVEVPVLKQFSFNHKNFDERMKRDAVIAVLDSGIDQGAAQGELKDALLKGVNLTENGGRDLLDDAVGHGTHMASIMAARFNNGEGMAGISNRLKILPIKVYDEEELKSQRTACGPAKRSIWQRVVEAMEIAIAQKVDVINLSMGWPRLANSVEVERVFRKALDAGIVIVAGAGNDGHDAQIYPCAYEGVICVGAMSPEGRISDFSNFGAHVDLVAPGEGILGLWPLSLVSNHFGPRGYEVQSGNSQAATFVSATAGVLRGMFPDEDGRSIRRRILNSAGELNQNEAHGKYVLFGRLDMAAAAESKPKDLVVPVFKGVELVKVDASTMTFALPLKIESSVSRSPIVQVKSLSREVRFSRLQLTRLDQSRGIYEFEVHGRVESLNQSSRMRIEVNVNGQSYVHSVRLVLDLTQTQTQAAAVSLPPSGRRLQMVWRPTGQTGVQFWETESLSKRGLKLKTWELERTEWKTKSVELEGANEVFPGLKFLAIEGLYDGQPGYLFGGMRTEKSNSECQKGHPKEFIFYYLDQELRRMATFPVRAEVSLPAYPDSKDVVLGSYRTKLGELVKVPVYLDEAKVPAQDLNPDHFAFEPNRTKRRVYFLEPSQDQGGSYFAVRALTASAFEQFVRRALDLDATQGLAVIGTEVQTREDLLLGRVNLIFYAGRGVGGRYYRLEIDDFANPFQLTKISRFDSGGRDLFSSVIEEAWAIGGKDWNRRTDIQTLYSFWSGRSLIKQEGGLSELNLSISPSAEKIAGVIKSFVRAGEQVTFTETSEGVRVKGSQFGKSIDEIASIYRSSFLPGQFFSQVYVPTLVGGDQLPAIMVDYSAFFAPAMATYVLNKNGHLEAPLRLSFAVPKDCEVNWSPTWTEQWNSRIAMSCEKDRKLYLIDLK